MKCSLSKLCCTFLDLESNKFLTKRSKKKKKERKKKVNVNKCKELRLSTSQTSQKDDIASIYILAFCIIGLKNVGACMCV